MSDEGRCFLCGRPNPRGGRVCASCAALAERGETPPLAGGQMRLDEAPVESDAALASAARRRLNIPLPPQIREERERELADSQRQTAQQLRASEDEQTRQAALRNAESLAERWRSRTETEGVAPVEGSVTCLRCGETNGDENVRFSFCVHCGADLPGVATLQRREEETLPFGVRNPRSAIRKIAQLHHQPQARVQAQAVAPQIASSRTDVHPGLNATLSFFFPGAGQLMNGQISKGVSVIVAGFIAVALFQWGPFGIPLVLGRIVAAVDAYRIGQRRQRGESVAEFEWDLG